MMIESMVAISAITIGLLGIMTLLIRSSQWNRDVGLQLRATHLAVEGIEVVKHLIDADIARLLSGDINFQWGASASDGEWGVVSTLTKLDPDDTSRPAPSNTLLFDSAQGYQYSVGEPSPFARKVVVSSEDEGEKKRFLVRAEVTWGRDGKVEIEDLFTYWRRQGGSN